MSALQSQAELATYHQMLQTVTSQLSDLDEKRKLLIVKKKYLENVLSTTLRTHELSKVSTSFGTVKYSKRKITNPLSNKQLDVALNKCYPSDYTTVAKIKQFIDNERQVRTIDKIWMPASSASSASSGKK